eukprot:6193513-Pleurochrysis_carterae.AAC.1
MPPEYNLMLVAGKQEKTSSHERTGRGQWRASRPGASIAGVAVQGQRARGAPRRHCGLRRCSERAYTSRACSVVGGHGPDARVAVGRGRLERGGARTAACRGRRRDLLVGTFAEAQRDLQQSNTEAGRVRRVREEGVAF